MSNTGVRSSSSTTRAQGDRGPSPAVAACVDAARAAERVGQRAEARSHYEAALRTLGSGDELPTATTIFRWIAGSHFAEANHDAAEDCVTAAIAVAEAWSDDVAVGYAINMLGMFRWQQGELDEAVQLYNDAREHAVRTGDAKLAAITAQNLGVIANVRGEFTRALQFYQASLADYRSMGLQRDVCVALNNLGMVYTDTERWDEAELSYREALELVGDLGDIALRVQIEVNVVEMWVERGDIPRAREVADAAVALASQMGDAHVPGDAYRLMGVIARESGDLAGAEEMLQRAVEIASSRQDLLLLAETSREQAEVHRRQGRNRETLQALNRAHQLFTQLRAQRDLADVDRQTMHLEGEFIDVVRRWGESIEAKDRYTQGHCERVADLACALATRSGFDERTLFWFRIGALLHDVGKLIIPAEVLNKPTKLTDDEWALMRRHPEAGVELLAGIDFPWDVRPLIESHHERWDGLGYPHGLAGEAIPLTARILCLADVFDALTSRRSYKQSMSVADALETMRRDVGRAFDPTLFEAFERVLAERDSTDTAPNAALTNAGSRRATRDELTKLPPRRGSTVGAAAPRRPSVERFVGRVAERRRLDRMLDSSLRGDARIVSIVGASGIGKTAIVSRLLLDVRRRGALHVVARCRPSTFPTPYAPWITVIEGLRAARIVPELRWHSLPRLVPSLVASQRSLRFADGGEPNADASVCAEIGDLVTIGAASRPLVLVLEDVQHADHATWEVIDHLARRLAGERILLCLTSDEAYAGTVRARLTSCRRHSEVLLPGLRADEVRHWINDVFPDSATATACVAYLSPSEPVSPLWSVHAMHGLVDDRRLAFCDGRWRAVDPVALAAAPRPSSVAAILSRRVSSLAPKTRAILGELGLLGDSFELDVALAAGIGEEAELLDAIDDALAAAVLRADGAEPGAAFAFTHPAVAAAAREPLDAMRLRRVHAQIARGLEQVRPVALFEIAEHFHRAGIADRAFEYALLAAARAVSVQAYADAAVAYSQARCHVTSAAQRRRLDELVAELPLRVGHTGVA